MCGSVVVPVPCSNHSSNRTTYTTSNTIRPLPDTGTNIANPRRTNKTNSSMVFLLWLPRNMISDKVEQTRAGYRRCNDPSPHIAHTFAFATTRLLRFEHCFNIGSELRHMRVSDP